MSIQIDRFKGEELHTNQTVKFNEKGWIAVKDRETGDFVGLVNLHKDYDKNMELASKVISVIESELNAED